MGKGAPDYTRLAHILGITETGKLIQIRVDDEGRMVSIMTGEYSGGSTILATDEDGRILAVITDPENIWGVRPLVGNAELCARLGSPVYYDRRGSVMSIESFNNGLSRIDPSGVGGAGSLTIVSEFARSYGYSCKITTRTAGDYDTGVMQYFDFPRPGNTLGHEFHIAPTGAQGGIYCYISVYTGTRYLIFGMKWDFVGKNLYYWGSGADWVDSGENMTMYHVAGKGLHWHNIKLVVDLVTEKYIRLLVDHLSVDLSAIACQASNSANDSETIVTTRGYGDAANSRTIYLDDLIFTVLEPE